jgi:hypothetical protein
VHIVRFASGLALFDATDEHSQRDEENRVRRIARAALLPVIGGQARRSLDLLCRVPIT